MPASDFHHGKTAVWNRGGEVLGNIEILEAAARRDDPTTSVWKGDLLSAPRDRGITILGTPGGHTGVRDEAVGKEGVRARRIVEQDSGHQGSPVCVACVCSTVPVQGRITF